MNTQVRVPVADGRGMEAVARVLNRIGGTNSVATSMFWPGSATPIDGIATRGELETYLAVHQVRGRNGRLHEVELTNVTGGWSGQAMLLPPAAAAWEEMREAATYGSQANAHQVPERREIGSGRQARSQRTWQRTRRRHHQRGRDRRR